MSTINHSDSGSYTIDEMLPEEARNLTLEQVMTILAYHIAENPEDIEVAVVNTDRIKVIEFDMHPSDRGPVIGRNGYIIKALHTVAKAILGSSAKDFTYKIDVRGGSAAGGYDD
jgi:predicted RNA-binding protein YlqC (UPF0109 family)